MESPMINNLYDFYKTTCEEYSDKMLFDDKITYAEAMKIAEEKAAFLQSEGFKKGDVIGLLALSNAEWCLTYMAINFIGGIVLPLDINLPKENFPAMLKRLKAKALFVSDDFKSAVKGIKTYSVSLNKSIEKKKKFKLPKLDENDIATYIYTSGTTGVPKIVSLTHKNIFSTPISAAKVAKLSPKDVFLCLLPLYHVYALVACFTGPFCSGSSIHFLTSLKGPDIMKALSDYPVTVFPAAPLLWEMFMDGIINKVKAESTFKYRLFTFFLKYGTFMRKIGLSFLVDKIFDPIHAVFGRNHRFFISGGASLKDKYRKYYKSMGFTLVEGYGLTETTGPITLSPVDKNILGSVGPAIPGNEAKIKNINEDGIGEVWLRGDAVMPGYWNNEEATREVFDEDGFFNSGDLGKMNKENYIFITGRFKNVIVLSSGKNVYPEELESYYKQSEAIEEIAVFSRNINGTEKVYAVIVPVNKTEKSYGIVKNELMRLNKGLPTYKTVNDFAISFDKLPVNSARKIVYREIIKLLEKGVFMEHDQDKAVLQVVLAGQTPAEAEVIDLLKKRLKTDKIFAKQSLADFGIDSLGLVDLIVHFEEKLKISIDIEKVKKFQTLDEMVPYVASLEKSGGESIADRLFRSEITEKPLLFFNPFLYFWIGLIKFLFRFIWKVEVVNREKLKYTNSILVANHTSYFDIPMIIHALPVRNIKNTYAIGKQEVAGVRYVFHGMPVIWADYEKNTNEVFKKSSDLLRQNKSIMIFPEGARTDTGKMMEFKLGAAYLAKNINREIIPVSINGAYDIWPSSRTFPKFTGGLKGKIVVHETINPNDYKTPESLNAALEKVIKSGLDPEINKKNK
jgi:long-chain acyl-CoA synthetase